MLGRQQAPWRRKRSIAVGAVPAVLLAAWGLLLWARGPTASGPSFVVSPGLNPVPPAGIGRKAGLVAGPVLQATSNAIPGGSRVPAFAALLGACAALAAASRQPARTRPALKACVSLGAPSPTHQGHRVAATATAATAPVEVQTFNIADVENLLDVNEPPVFVPAPPKQAAVAARPAAVVAMAVAPAGTPAAEPDAKTTSSTSRSYRAARMAGGSRCSSPRGRRDSDAAGKQTRRHAGARLMERSVIPEVPQPAFDSSQLRLKIQIGLTAASSMNSERGREARTPSASKFTSVTTDARIQEKDFGEHFEQEHAKNTICVEAVPSA